jgi:hypothetical protein
MTPAQITARLNDWRQLIEVDPAPGGPGTNRRLVDR